MGTDPKKKKGHIVQRQGPESPGSLVITPPAAPGVLGDVVAEEWGLRRPEGVSVTTIAGEFQFLTTSIAILPSLNWDKPGKHRGQSAMVSFCYIKAKLSGLYNSYWFTLDYGSRSQQSGQGRAGRHISFIWALSHVCGQWSSASTSSAGWPARGCVGGGWGWHHQPPAGECGGVHRVAATF